MKEEILFEAETIIKYSGYINRQKEEIDKIKVYENMIIPEKFDYNDIKSLSNESREKFINIKPQTVGQAQRINGIRPSDISILLVYLKRPFHVKQMVGLQDRLLSRFESGLHADIQPPDFETRVAILSTKAKQNNMKIEGSHLEKIASHVRTNIRDLESCVTKIFAHATLSGDKINEALVESIIRERLGDQGYGQVNMQDVVSGVCSIFSVSQEEMVGQSRRKNIAEARQVAAYLAREVLDMPLSEIGVHLGGRDHTTIMHAHKKVSELLKNDDKFKRRVDIIYNELNLS